MAERGTVVQVGLATAAGEPMREAPALMLVPGVGVAGDRYAEGGGHWSGWPDREVTLVEAEVADALGARPLDLRRNIVTRGVALDRLVGRAFTVGDARLEGVRPCDPCRYLAELLGRPPLLHELAGRGGLRARVLQGGSVRAGDPVEPL